jgi:hypothetical protein
MKFRIARISKFIPYISLTLARTKARMRNEMIKPPRNPKRVYFHREAECFFTAYTTTPKLRAIMRDTRYIT